MKWRRVYALFVGRNLEFVRDRSSFAWSLALPLLILVGFAFVFNEDNPEKFRVGLVAGGELEAPAAEFRSTRYIRFIDFDAVEPNLRKVERHQLDLLFDVDNRRYWINRSSPNGYIAEKLLIAAYAGASASLQQVLMEGGEIRYLDWVVPGVIGMNIMWGALFGIGYVIVRYRNSGVLKRISATPVTAMEFLSAQILSRLWLLLIVNLVIFVGMDLFVDLRMYGSYLNLLLVFVLGAVNLICCGLVVAARIASEELANGLLNLLTWPMMFLSGVWFSLEGAPDWMQQLALLLPLTHITEAAREVMIDGAGLLGIADHLLVLGLSSALLLLIGARIFRWE